MTPIYGKPFYGPSDERRTVVSFNDTSVSLVSPLSEVRSTMSRDEFDAWSLASKRRTYVGADGEVRTKIQTFERPLRDPLTGKQMLDEAGLPATETVVEFMRGLGTSHVVPWADWLAWRNQAE